MHTDEADTPVSQLTNPEAEAAILGAIATESCLDPVAALRLVEANRLTAEDFALAAHADLFRAAMVLLGRGAAVDVLTVASIVESSSPVRAAGGRKWFCDVLMDSTTGAFSLPSHARLVRDLASRRHALAALRATAAALQDTDKPLDGTLTEGQASWATIANRREGLGTAEADMLALVDTLEQVQTGLREPVLATGIHGLDALIGGLQPTLTVIGALSGVGKSALLATILRNVSSAGKKVGLFSLEDERSWVARRLTSEAAAVPLFLLANRPLGVHQLERVRDAAQGVHATLSRVVIDDRGGLTPSEIVQGARDMILNHGCKAVLLDHLGELRYPGGIKERFDLQIADALGQLRGLAKQYGVPVVVACHLRRRDGLSATDEPKLTDFANSASIERTARVALGLSRVNGRLLVSVLKQTSGKAGVSVELDLNEPAAIVQNGEPMNIDAYDEDEKRMLNGREAAPHDF